MKHNATLLLLIAAIFLHTNAQAYSQGITLKVSDVTLDKVFSLLQKQTKFVFVYSAKQLSGTKRVSVDVTNEKFEKVMQMVMDGQPLRYELDKDYVIIKMKDILLYYNNDSTKKEYPGELTGKVVNEKGEPIVGATVAVKGQNIVTATGINGDFTIKVSNKATLVISSIGYEPKIIKVNENFSSLSITLSIVAQQIQEVVVATGYQKISKERFVGSFSKLDSAAFHRRAGMGILERLDGTVTGVLFNSENKQTRDMSKLQIRGISTLVGGARSPSGDPLIILNNFPYTDDLNTINPNDVESITVLRDAAAASIWGAKAGNGVIVITTKKGKYNQSFSVTVSSNISVLSKRDYNYFPQLNSSQFIELEKDLFSKTYYSKLLNSSRQSPVTPVVEILNKLENGEITEAEADVRINELRAYDIRSELNEFAYGRKLSQQHYLSISGGSNVTRYSLSVGYNMTDPEVRRSASIGQLTINSNFAMKPAKDLEVRLGITLSQSSDKTRSFSNPFTYPYQKLVDQNGTSLPQVYDRRKAYIDTAGAGGLLDWHYYPLDEISLVNKKDLNRSAIISMEATYNIFDWLSAQVSSQFTVQSINAKSEYSQNSFFARNQINQFTNLDEFDQALRYPIPLGGILEISNGESRSMALRGQILINKSWKNTHTIQAMLSGDISENRGNGSAQRIYGYEPQNGNFNNRIDYSKPYLQFGRNGETSLIPSGNSFNDGLTNRFLSITTNMSYTYLNKYTIYGSSRRDGTNLVGANTNDRWKPLWSAGAGWDVSKESFFSIGWVSNLKLRASYGYSGNVNNQISSLTTIQYSGLAGFSNLPYAAAVDAANPNLRWEQVRIFNVGIDFSILRNRIGGEVELYNKRSTDLISSLPFSPSRGVLVYSVNAASMKGRGFDISINSKNTTGKFEWRSNLGVSYSKMIITDIYKPNLVKAGDFLDYGLNASVGRIAYGISSFRWGGLDPTTGDPQGILDNKVSKDYVGIFNDSIENQVFHGSAIPLYYGFLGNSISWKGFTLSANILFKFNYYFRKPSFSLSQIASGYAYSDYLNRWQKSGDELITHIPSVIYPVPVGFNGRDRFYANSEVHVDRADNIRLQDLKLQFAIGSVINSNSRFRNVQVYLYVNNINWIIWKKSRSSLDPDFTNSNIGVQLPAQKTFTTGLSWAF